MGTTRSSADVDEAAAAECVADLARDGLAARYVVLDVTDVARVREVVARVDAETPLATVVANAGVALRRPLVDVEPAEYDRVMDVNVRGVFFVVQAAVRAMTPRGRGSVVTVCSTSGFTASTGPMTVYDTSKGAVRLLTQAAAREAAGSGVRVNAVAPGTVETDLTLALASGDELEALGRRAGSARPARTAAGDRGRRRVPVLGRGLVRDGPRPRRGRRVAGVTQPFLDNA